MAEFAYNEMFPLTDDRTTYRQLTTDTVSTASFDDTSILTIDSK